MKNSYNARVSSPLRIAQIASKLRAKLYALQVNNGCDRSQYASSVHFQILHNRRADLDFLMQQSYNGVTRPPLGVDGSGGGQMCCSVVWEFE